MDNNQAHQVSFFEAFLGLLSAPRLTLEELLSEKEPPFVWQLFLTLLLLLLGPIIWQIWRQDFLETRTLSIVALALILCITATLFVFVEYLFLRSWKVNFSIQQISALFTYCCVPLGALALCYYILNLMITQGRLTVATTLITGVKDADDWLITLFPYIQIMAKAWFIYLFYCGIKFLGNLRNLNAFIISFLSSVPFYLCLLLAIYLTGLISPSSTQGVMDLLLSFQKI